MTTDRSATRRPYVLAQRIAVMASLVLVSQGSAAVSNSFYALTQGFCDGWVWGSFYNFWNGDVECAGRSTEQNKTVAKKITHNVATKQLNLTSLAPRITPDAIGSSTNQNRTGTCIVGYQDAGNGTPYHAFRWTEATGPVDLGTLDPPNNATRSSSAQATSDDCNVIVGYSDTTSTFIWHAFRWTAAGGMVDLAPPGGPTRQSRAFGVSADGSVVVGDAEFADTASFSGFRNGAYRWSGGSFQALGALTAGYPSLATAISADGATIVGTASLSTSPTTTGQQAFRWTQATGMVSLGTLPGVTNAMATGVSDNGGVIVGNTSTAGATLGHSGSLGFDRGSGTFRWTAASGMRDLRELLVDAGVNMTGIALLSVTGMSTDGQWITGEATTPATSGGERVGYIVQYCDDAIGAACAQIGGGGAASFALAASSATLSVAAGQSASTTLTVTPSGGFVSPVSFACSGLPAGAACSFGPASVTPAGGAATTTLTISTESGPVAVWLRSHPGSALAVLLPAFALGRRRGRRDAAMRTTLVVLAAAAWLVACGGGGGDGGGGGSGGGNPPPPGTGTPAGTSTVTVTASGGGLTQTSTLTLTVTR